MGIRISITAGTLPHRSITTHMLDVAVGNKDVDSLTPTSVLAPWESDTTLQKTPGASAGVAGEAVGAVTPPSPLAWAPITFVPGPRPASPATTIRTPVSYVTSPTSRATHAIYNATSGSNIDEDLLLMGARPVSSVCYTDSLASEGRPAYGHMSTFNQSSLEDWHDHPFAIDAVPNAMIQLSPVSTTRNH